MRLLWILLMACTKSVTPASSASKAVVRSYVPSLVINENLFNISCSISNALPRRVSVIDGNGNAVLVCDIASGNSIQVTGYGAFAPPNLDVSLTTQGCSNAFMQAPGYAYPFYVTAKASRASSMQNGVYKCSAMYFMGAQMAVVTDLSPPLRLTVIFLPFINLVVPYTSGSFPIDGLCSGISDVLPILKLTTTCQTCQLIVSNNTNVTYTTRENGVAVTYLVQKIFFLLEYTYAWDGASLACTAATTVPDDYGLTTRVSVPAPLFSSAIPATAVAGLIFNITCSTRNARITRIDIMDSKYRSVMWCDCYNVYGVGAFAPGYLITDISNQSCTSSCRGQASNVSFFVSATTNPLQDGKYMCSYAYMNGSYISKFIGKPSALLITTVKVTSTIPSRAMDGSRFVVSCTLSRPRPTKVYVAHPSEMLAIICYFDFVDFVAAGYEPFAPPFLDVNQTSAGCLSSYNQTPGVYQFYLTAKAFIMQDGFYQCFATYKVDNQELKVKDSLPPTRLTVITQPIISLVVPSTNGSFPVDGKCTSKVNYLHRLQLKTSCNYCQLIIQNVSNGTFNDIQNGINVTWFYQSVTFLLEYSYSWNGALLTCTVTGIPEYNGSISNRISIPAPVFASSIPASVIDGSWYRISCTATNARITRIEVLDSLRQPVMWCNCNSINGTGAFSITKYLDIEKSNASCTSSCAEQKSSVDFVVSTNPAQGGTYACSYFYWNGSYVSQFIDTPSTLVITVLNVSTFVPASVMDGSQFTISCTTYTFPARAVKVVDQSGAKVLECFIYDNYFAFVHGYMGFSDAIDNYRSYLACRNAFEQLGVSTYTFYLTAKAFALQDGLYTCSVTYQIGPHWYSAMDPSQLSRLTVIYPPGYIFTVPWNSGISPIDGVCYSAGNTFITLNVTTSCRYCQLVITSVKNGTNIESKNGRNVTMYTQAITFLLEYTYTWDRANLTCAVTSIPGYKDIAFTQLSVPAPVFNSSMPISAEMNSRFTFTCSATYANITRIDILDSNNNSVMWSSGDGYNVNGTGVFGQGNLVVASSYQRSTSSFRYRQTTAVFVVVATVNPVEDGYYACSYSYMNGSYIFKFTDKPSPLVITVAGLQFGIQPPEPAYFNLGDNATITCGICAKPPLYLELSVPYMSVAYEVYPPPDSQMPSMPDFRPLRCTNTTMKFLATADWSYVTVFCRTHVWYLISTKVYIRQPGVGARAAIDVKISAGTTATINGWLNFILTCAIVLSTEAFIMP